MEQPISVSGGKEKTVSVCPSRSAYALTKRGEKSNVTIELYYDDAKAPIEKGDTVGEMVIFKDGVEADRLPMVAAASVKKATFFDRLQEIARNWNG